MNELLDQVAISLLIEQYFYGVDRRDAALIRNCFADEATYSSDAGALNMDSGDEIGRRLGRGGRYAQTSHMRTSTAPPAVSRHPRPEGGRLEDRQTPPFHQVAIRGNLHRADAGLARRRARRG